eukprot:257860_1
MQTMSASKSGASKISNETFVSSLQFSSCMGNAAWSKFSSLFFLENGITPSELAVITFIQSVAKLLGYPTFGIIADIFENSKSLLLLSLIMSNTTLLLFYFPFTKSIIFGNFYLLLFTRGFRSYCNCIWSLIDTVTMRLIADKKTYGKHRLYGSLAWGLSSLIAGKLIDLNGMDAMFIYGVFWSMFTFALIYFLMPATVPNYEQHKYESLSVIDIGNIEYDGENDTNDKILKDNNNVKFNCCQLFTLLISVRHDYQFILSLVIMLIYWNAMFIIDRILFIQMDQEFGATKFMNGIATLSSTLPSLPFFYYSAHLMRKYSLNTLYLFCHIVLVVRLCAYLFCKDISMIWLVYLIETLHGINFGLGFAVCRVYLY